MTDQLALAQICSLYATDKNVLHSYVDNVYEDLFKNLRQSTKKMLEIGVETGGSLLMWREYFPNVTITGVDIKPCPQVIGRDRIEFVKGDAYNYEIADNLPSDFDIIIDDGPHTLESMTFVVLEYLKKIKNDGILVIEDIQDFNWTNILRRMLPNNFRCDVRDLRKVRGRYDDILMIIKQDELSH
jgi:SAM-dependent methyltransferase